MSKYVENNEIQFGTYVIEDNNSKFTSGTEKNLLDKFNSIKYDNIEKVKIIHINTQPIINNNKKLYAHEFKVIYIEKISIDFRQFDLSNSYNSKNNFISKSIDISGLNYNSINNQNFNDLIKQKLAEKYNVPIENVELLTAS